tara:strand:+ start:2939 stop:3715 length:777 start_codon:yes stop_codon:yes gene_type:complete
MTHEEFVSHLRTLLGPYYAYAEGGHGWPHVNAVANLFHELYPLAPYEVDKYEFLVLALLHNADRCARLLIERGVVSDEDALQALGKRARQDAVYHTCITLLEKSPFDDEAQDRIAQAVVHHGERFHEGFGTELQQMLQIADMLSRLMRPCRNIFDGAAHGGGEVPLYRASNPFDFRMGSGDSILKFLFWNLEWYAWLPEWARSLVDPESIQFFVKFLRMLGAEIAEELGWENDVERYIETALGRQYVNFRRDQRAELT